MAVLLKINIESIDNFEIRNPEIPPDSLGDKFCRLDINMDVNDQRVDLEVTRHTPLTDRLSMFFFELPKLPQMITVNSGQELWLSLFRAKTEEDLLKIEALGVQEMNDAINAYRHITVTPEFQEAERLRSKARHDEAQALWNAERNTKLNIAKNLLIVGDSIEKVISVTGLTRVEVETLRNTE